MEAQVDAATTTVLTLRFDDRSQEHFESMRQRFFPTELNQISAHLTLFHKLPPAREITHTLLQKTGQCSAFKAQVSGLRSLGHGVAYTLTSAELMSLHRQLADAFGEHLSSQDRQKFQPHVVIQNKVTGAKARDLMALLQPAFRPFQVEALGVDLWHYLGGPWELADTYLFPQ